MNSYKVKILFLLILLILPRILFSQIRAGSGYLKLNPGSREAGLAGATTSALDYTYSFYRNPAATGLIREWQWSATYTNWISDIYNTSFLYAMKLSNPLSRDTKVAIGINYLGIPDFKSSESLSTYSSGNNLLVTGSIGQPFDIAGHQLVFGMNTKYFRSNLAEYNAVTIINDFGVLFRTKRYMVGTSSNKLLNYLIFSTGISLTNVGKPIKYISEETPLPQTFNSGVAINLGTHNWFQFNIGYDYHKVRDEAGFSTIGSEMSWRNLIALRFGYSFENNLLGHVTFGGSFRFDFNFIKGIIPGRNNALRLNLASTETNAFFTSPYHGSITHIPIGPESFDIIYPAYNEIFDQDSLTLKWQSTTDPDLYDDCKTWLIVNTDSTVLYKIKQYAEQDIE